MYTYEVCPYCNEENEIFVVNTDYEAVCQHCGKPLMLCTLCHDDMKEGQKCNWTETGCFRQKKSPAYAEQHTQTKNIKSGKENKIMSNANIVKLSLQDFLRLHDTNKDLAEKLDKESNLVNQLSDELEEVKREVRAYQDIVARDALTKKVQCVIENDWGLDPDKSDKELIDSIMYLIKDGYGLLRRLGMPDHVIADYIRTIDKEYKAGEATC